MRQDQQASFISMNLFAKFLAAVAAVLAVSHLVAQFRAGHSITSEAPSFLQVTQRIRGHAQKCPKVLLEEYPDCTVVPFRGNIPIGRSGLKPPASSFSVMAYVGLDEQKMPQGQRFILGWKPEMRETKSTCKGQDEKVSLVHHVNAYMYKNLKLPSGRVFQNGDPELLSLSEDDAVMVASHDKLAGTYILPPGYGIPADSPITLEYHLLFPTCWDHDSEDQIESSGMDLYMTGARTKYPAALIGALNFNMDVAPHQGAVDYVTRLSAENIQQRLLSNWAAPRNANILAANEVDDPKILAVHLHTHDLTDGKFLEIVNADGSTAFRSDEEKGGYGLKEQSFLSLAEKGWPELTLKPGQTLQQHCKINSDHLDHTLIYGLDWGQEMCAPLLIVGGPGIDSPPTLMSTQDTHINFLGRMLSNFAEGVVREMGRLIAP